MTAVKHVMFFLMCCVNVISHFVTEVEDLFVGLFVSLVCEQRHKKQQLLFSGDIISIQAEPSCLLATHLSTPGNMIRSTNPSEEICICLLLFPGCVMGAGILF